MKKFYLLTLIFLLNFNLDAVIEKAEEEPRNYREIFYCPYTQSNDLRELSIDKEWIQIYSKKRKKFYARLDHGQALIYKRSYTTESDYEDKRYVGFYIDKQNIIWKMYLPEYQYYSFENQIDLAELLRKNTGITLFADREDDQKIKIYFELDNNVFYLGDSCVIL